MNWCSVDNNYLDFLRQHGDRRVPYNEYFSDDGKKLLKPFFTPLFSVSDLVYITQITSPKPRHYKMKSSLDFIKVYKDLEDRKNTNDVLFGAINLNFMFPVPKEFIGLIEYSEIEHYRIFDSEEEKSKYIDLLRKELKKINSSTVQNNAKKLYKLKEEFPNNNISKRCLDFKKLEEVAKDFKKNGLI